MADTDYEYTPEEFQALLEREERTRAAQDPDFVDRMTSSVEFKTIKEASTDDG